MPAYHLGSLRNALKSISWNVNSWTFLWIYWLTEDDFEPRGGKFWYCFFFPLTYPLVNRGVKLKLMISCVSVRLSIFAWSRFINETKWWISVGGKIHKISYCKLWAYLARRYLPWKRRGTYGEHVFLRGVTIDFTDDQASTWSFILEVCEPVNQSAIAKSLKNFREGIVSTTEIMCSAHSQFTGFPHKMAWVIAV